MKALQQHLIEKSEKIDQLTEHVARLQYELKQQNALVSSWHERMLQQYVSSLYAIKNGSRKIRKENKVSCKNYMTG